MNFSHYSGRPVELAIELINTRQIDEDLLDGPHRLEEFLERYRELWEDAAQPPRADELDAVKDLRESLRSVIESHDDAEAADRVNQILERYGATPRVSVHSGEPHFHFEPANTAMICWLGAVTAMALAGLLVEHGIERFGVCDSSTCEDVYIDTSRNRSRRHCSSTCSTREAVAAYRRRQAQ